MFLKIFKILILIILSFLNFNCSTKIKKLENYKKEKNNVDNYIIKCSDDTEHELKQQLNNDILEWKNIKNPIIAKYIGNEILDYFHLEFKDKDGKIYDFGTGNNNYGQYELFEKLDHYVDNPKYLNKKFKIFWSWKKSTFPCCSGNYNLVIAMQPSIKKIVLLEN